MSQPLSILTRPQLISGLEFLGGAAIVIGHNVYGVVPNEVVILFVVGLVSMRLRNGAWSAIGFKRPALWRRIILIALAAAALRIILGEFIESFAGQYWPAVIAPAGAEKITGNFKMALLALLIVWTFAAFGEEISYRGYLLTRAAEFGGGSAAAWWFGMIVISVLFGLGHYYKGPVGMIDSGVSGFILGAAYLVSGRNLWICVLAHGFINTFGIVVLYLGWDT